jgi:hypothetical protein
MSAAMAQFQVLPWNSPGETHKNTGNLRNSGLRAEVWNPDLPNMQ